MSSGTGAPHGKGPKSDHSKEKPPQNLLDAALKAEDKEAGEENWGKLKAIMEEQLYTRFCNKPTCELDYPGKIGKQAYESLKADLLAHAKPGTETEIKDRLLGLWSQCAYTQEYVPEETQALLDSANKRLESTQASTKAAVNGALNRDAGHGADHGHDAHGAGHAPATAAKHNDHAAPAAGHGHDDHGHAKPDAHAAAGHGPADHGKHGAPAEGHDDINTRWGEVIRELVFEHRASFTSPPEIPLEKVPAGNKGLLIDAVRNLAAPKDKDAIEATTHQILANHGFVDEDAHPAPAHADAHGHDHGHADHKHDTHAKPAATGHDTHAKAHDGHKAGHDKHDAHGHGADHGHDSHGHANHAHAPAAAHPDDHAHSHADHGHAPAHAEGHDAHGHDAHGHDAHGHADHGHAEAHGTHDSQHENLLEKMWRVGTKGLGAIASMVGGVFGFKKKNSHDAHGHDAHGHGADHGGHGHDAHADHGHGHGHAKPSFLGNLVDVAKKGFNGLWNIFTKPRSLTGGGGGGHH